MGDSLLREGLTLMLAGMGTVFVFLTALVFAMSAMSRLLGRLQPAPAAAVGTDTDAETVAAISAAIEQHRRKRT